MTHVPPASPRRARRLGFPASGLPAALAGALILAACGGPRQVVVVGPPVDAGQVALRAENVTELERPSRIVFSWSLAEGGVRVQGQGVARVEPRYKARLDLFLSNGEPAARASMVDDELRVPPGMPDGILPPPHLMWGTLGVFRPGLGTGLLGGDPVDGGGVRLKYRLPGGDEVHYQLDTTRQIRQVEVLRSGTVIQRLTLERDEERFPKAATYRDMTSFRELKLTRESVQHVEPFPPDIWVP